MRKTLGVSLLVLLLTCPAFAGIMQNGSPTPPPPQPATAAEETPAVEDGTQDATAPDALTQITLELLAALL